MRRRSRTRDPVVLSLAGRLEALWRRPGAARRERGLPCRRDPRRGRGERVREVDAARDRERRPRSRRGRGRDRGAAACTPVDGRRGACASGSAWRTRRYSQVLRPVGGREPLPGSAAGGSGLATGRWSRGPPASSREFDLDVDPRRAHREPSRSPSGSSSRSSRRCSLEPKVLLLDEPTTALGPDEVERLHALVLERWPARGGRRLREPPPARGAGGRRPDHGAPRRGRARGPSRRRGCRRTTSSR